MRTSIQVQITLTVESSFQGYIKPKKKVDVDEERCEVE